VKTASASWVGLLLVLAHGYVRAGGVPTANLGEIEVNARRLQGTPQSASQGTVERRQLEHRPILRVGEVLEVVPGLIVTQHSGSGKANQYFLRGFNLDHGTDFATHVDGVPVNMPTHAHGQGYTDVNFVIPELVESIEYRKGTYYAEEGNFSAAGAVNMRYARALEQGIVEFGGGQDGYRRGLLADSLPFGGGDLLYAFDYTRSDGPWDLAESLRRANAQLRYSRGDRSNGFSFAAMAYDSEWASTDQVPQRAIDKGEIGRLGFVDGSDGGGSNRYSQSFEWARTTDERQWRALAYGIDYQLDLFSNFTYFTDPANGDQFEQFDDRRVYGGSVSLLQPLALGGFEGEFVAGVELRRDDIDTVGLYRTIERVRFATTREDDVRQTSIGAFVSQQINWNERLRTTLGVRADRFDFDVSSDNALNSGSAHGTLVSPKLTAVFKLSDDVELFADVGGGFHSNDARGTTIRVDPTDGVTPASRVDPLVRATGGEIGARAVLMPGLQIAGSLWALDLDSELLFIGDGGSTEANRASERRGIELAAYWQPLRWLVVDLDLAWSHASFSEGDPAADHIPGAVETVGSLGLVIEHPSGWYGGARLRYVGEAPLIEDDSVRSDPTTLLNLEAGYRFSNDMSLEVSVLNALDSDDNDISYFYESQLADEANPVEDIHLHPVEPRTIRVGATVRF
jgi:outer membrane receptor protein involved in Fe transport